MKDVMVPLAEPVFGTQHEPMGVFVQIAGASTGTPGSAVFLQMLPSVDTVNMCQENCTAMRHSVENSALCRRLSSTCFQKSVLCGRLQSSIS